MKNFKRYLCLLLAAVLMFSLCACGKDDDQGDKMESSAASQEPTVAPTATPVPEAQVDVVVVTGDGVYIRADASTENNPIASADKGDTFKLVDKSNPDWLGIEYDGKTAYITTLYAEVKPITESAYNKMFPAEPETPEDEEAEEGDENDVGSEASDDAPVTAEDARDSEDGER